MEHICSAINAVEIADKKELMGSNAIRVLRSLILN
jgi:hypothetical protein